MLSLPSISAAQSSSCWMLHPSLASALASAATRGRKLNQEKKVKELKRTNTLPRCGNGQTQTAEDGDGEDEFHSEQNEARKFMGS